MAIPDNRNSSGNLFNETQIDGIFLMDIWESYKLGNEIIEEDQLFIEHKVRQYERWYDLAETYYDDRNLWWIILLTNRVEDPFSLYVDSIIPSTLDTIKILKPERAEEVAVLVRDARINKNFEFEAKLKRNEEVL
jgi:hypothetical protein